MSYKLTIIWTIVQIVAYTRSQEPHVNWSSTAKYRDQFSKSSLPSSYCNLSIPTSMNFLYNQRCVQFVFGSDDELYSAECIANIMRNSHNITFLVRSMTWFLNRNIHKEESTVNVMKGKSIRYCENFLIFLKNVSSLKATLNAATARITVSVSMLFPFSKLYFLLANKRYEFVQSEIIQISSFFYEKSQFGYLYELDEATKKIKLLDLLSFNYVDHNESGRTNLVHPFLNRENTEKEFRVTFHECYPYIIYVNEDNLR